jgi:hypothetical protein
MLSLAEITREGRVRRAFGMLATARRVRRGCYEVRGIPGGWHSTIIVQPSQLPPGDCATLCASPQPGPARSDDVIVHTYAAVSLDVTPRGHIVHGNTNTRRAPNHAIRYSG